MRKHWICVCILGLISFGVTACGTPPPPPPPAPPLQAPPIKQKLEASCAVCGMPVVDACQNRFEGAGATAHLCSAICAASYVQKTPAQEATLKVVDFQTRALIPVADAFYLKGSKLTVIGAMPPTVAAFGDRKAADQAAKNNGGKVLDWKAVLAELQKAPEFQAH